MARRKTPQFPPPDESEDQREERESRIAELTERAQRHQRLADTHIHRAERLNAEASKPRRKRR